MCDRNQVLDRAKTIINGERQDQYGKPENNFAVIAGMWSCYLGMHIKEVDVAMMMALLKIARIESGTMTEDSFVDLIGYAALGSELVNRG